MKLNQAFKMLFFGSALAASSLRGQNPQLPQLQAPTTGGTCETLKHLKAPTKFQILMEKARIAAAAKTGVVLPSFTDIQAELARRCAAEQAAAAKAVPKQ